MKISVSAEHSKAVGYMNKCIGICSEHLADGADDELFNNYKSVYR